MVDMTTILQDNAKTAKAEAQDRALSRKIDDHFRRTHRQAPNGRNAQAFRMRFLDNPNYRKNFDAAFPGAPGGPGWFAKKFAGKKEDLDKPRNIGYHTGVVSG